MIQRFQIEDLIAQDEFGVVFRAVDSETGKNVAVRRFFPFGASGGGLHAEEQTAYNVALSRLAGISHPAMRAVICGGCDPVDGMPFIATEWIDGEPLETFIQQGPLPANVATDLITQALEVSELLSHVLNEDAVWVETSLKSIIVGSPESGRGCTFWICPLKWFGGQEKARSLACIADLTENLMGWRDRKMNDQAGQGLAGWLKWLRNAGDTISLYDARETLAASVGVPPPPPAAKLLAQATRPLAAKQARPSSSKGPWIINILLALAAVSLGVWYWVRQHNFEATKFIADAAPPTAAHNANPSAPPPAQPRDSHPADQPAATPDPSGDDPSNGTVAWTNRAFLTLNHGQEVIVEGPLEKIDFSASKKTMYLLFSKSPASTDARGSVEVENAAPDLTEESLAPLLGKKVRLHGTIEVHSVFGTKRPEIVITDRASVEPAE